MRSSLSRLVVYGLVGLGVSSALAQVKIYWTATDGSGAYVVRANGDGSNPVNIVSGATNILGPNGLETANSLLYWPDQQLGAIKQANLDGTGVATFRLAQNPYDVFANAQQVYWTSQEYHYIDTQLTSGAGYLRLLASPNVDRPFAIEVIATNLYWSRVSGSGSVLRSDLNGGNIVTLIPNAYVYDLQVTSNYIYFCNNNYPSGIKRANLDGTGVTNLITDTFGIGLLNGVCVTADAIYWSALNDDNGGGIRRASLSGLNRTNLYNAPGGTAVRGVVVFSDVITAPASPRFTSTAIVSGLFSYTLQVDSGRTYRVETSGDLTNWTELTNFVSAGTSVTFTNVIPPGTTNLFFRARTP